MRALRQIDRMPANKPKLLRREGVMPQCGVARRASAPETAREGWTTAADGNGPGDLYLDDLLKWGSRLRFSR